MPLWPRLSSLSLSRVLHSLLGTTAVLNYCNHKLILLVFHPPSNMDVEPSLLVSSSGIKCGHSSYLSCTGFIILGGLFPRISLGPWVLGHLLVPFSHVTGAFARSSGLMARFSWTSQLMVLAKVFF